VLEFDGLNALRNSEMPSFSQADKPVMLATKFKSEQLKVIWLSYNIM
jgi:hypothetical protein